MRERRAAIPLPAAQAAAADAGLKAMMPFGRPFLDHVLHALADAGVREASLVIGREHDEVRAYYQGLATTRLRITFVEQAEPLGTADAVWSARDWALDGSFLVLNADNLYPADVLRRMVDGIHPALPGFELGSLGIPPERAASFALLETVGDRLAQIVEKPGLDAVHAAGPHASISMNLWRFDARIFPACRDVPVSARGERELPQAVQLAVSNGVPFEVIPVRGMVLDLSSREDVARVARALEGRVVDF
jgi:glucose-1-phosphate thymidylyltransferase